MLYSTFRRALFFLLLVNLPCIAGSPPNPPPVPAPLALRLESPDRTQTITLDDLLKKLKPSTLKVMNPLYQRKMSYRGFWLEDLLKAAQGPKGPDIVFICRDGYTALLPAGSLKKHRWLLAYQETSGHWTLMTHDADQASPAPWCLVGAKADSFASLPWPYQIVTLRFLKNW